ncbi:acyltransferase [Micrococcaceae bacterium Sec5.7]
MALAPALKWLSMLPMVSVNRRWRILAFAGLNVRGVGIEAGVHFGNPNLTVGSGSYINRGVIFDGEAPIVIGERVAIGPQAMILTSTHDVGPSSWRAGAGVPSYAPVTIGDGVWIGAGAIILPGTVIEDGCIIAAGAVVRGHCAADQLWAGVPATAKRPLSI